MLFECKIKRNNGSTVVWNGVVHKFVPLVKGGPHVCEVTDPELIARLKANPAFAPCGEASKVEEEQDEAPKVPRRVPELLKVGNETVPARDIVLAAFEKSGLNVKQWNALSDDRAEELCFQEYEARLNAIVPADQKAEEADGGGAQATEPAASGENSEAPAVEPEKKGGKKRNK